MKKNNSGITLITLVITIVVLLIIAAIGFNSGISTVKSARLTKFTTEMKIMQVEVNELYDSYTNNRSVTINGIEYVGNGQDETNGHPGIQEIGRNINDAGQDKVSKAFSADGSGITQTDGYMYYDLALIEGLGIDGVESEFFVNVAQRSVISVDGFEYEEETYYTLEQLPDGLYNVEYNGSTEKPTFSESIESIEDGNYRITVSNIEHEYINKWQVLYQKEGETSWSTSDELSFVVADKGPYNIKLKNGEIESEVQVASYDSKFVKKWASEIDGNGEEEFLDVKQTSDGGYIAVGYTTSTDIEGIINKGSADCLIAKYDSNGVEQWKKNIGGSKYDWYSGVIEITDGTYIAVGTILSTDVVDKDGNNIGHGYDWAWQFDNYSGSMVASEGIIGKYDSQGNELSLNVTGKATNTYDGTGWDEWNMWGIYEDTTMNIMISGIEKLADGNYIIMGKRVLGLPNTLSTTQLIDGPLAMKYDSEGNQLTETEFILSDSYYANNGSNQGSPENFKDILVEWGTWKGVLETQNEYIFWGNDRTWTQGETNLYFTNKDLETKEGITFGGDDAIRKGSSIRALFKSNNDYIALNYMIMNDTFQNVARYGEDGSEVWEKFEDIELKSISKLDEENFVAIQKGDENDILQKYSADNGNVLEEYEIPTYEKVYTIEGKEGFVFLGSPTNEEGITITGETGAVIAKYAIE